MELLLRVEILATLDSLMISVAFVHNLNRPRMSKISVKGKERKTINKIQIIQKLNLAFRLDINGYSCKIHLSRD